MRTIKTLLSAAEQASEKGNSADAERLYKQALETAEATYGLDNVGVALVLLDLEVFYESEGRHTEAKPVRDRMREIMRRYLNAMSL
jgi:hypothetical protein